MSEIEDVDRRPPLNPPNRPNKTTSTSGGGGDEAEDSTSVIITSLNSIATALSEISQKLDVLTQTLACTQQGRPSTTTGGSESGTTSSDNRSSSKSDDDEEHQTLVKCISALDKVERKDFNMSSSDYVKAFNYLVLSRDNEWRKMFLEVSDEKKRWLLKHIDQ